MRWPWQRVQNTSTLSISDPAIAGWFQIGGPNLSGVNVGEGSAMALSAVYRAVSLISGTLASLPLRSLREPEPGQRERVASVFDDPGGVDGQTPFAWKETLFAHLLLHGNAFALIVRNQAGGLASLPLVHPLCVQMDLPTPDEYNTGKLPRGGKWFTLTLADGERVRYDANDVLHIPGMSLDGWRGMSVIAVARNSLGTTIAADRAAAKVFNSGALISGIVSPQDETDEFEAAEIKRQLDLSISGYENAGAIAVINRRLNFQPWTMTAADAQFLQSRQFQIEEIARWFGVPPFELMQTEKQTSWGTGIEAQQRGLGRTVLAPWATRVQEAGSRLLARPRFIEFDFSGLERPTPDTEIALLIQQIDAGLLTLNEARAIRNMPPVPGGDAVKGATAPAPNQGDPNANT